MADDLKAVCRQFLEILDAVEENDEGRPFHPTHISSCRIQHSEKLAKIIPRMSELVNGSTEVSSDG